MLENNFVITEAHISAYADYLRDEERAAATIVKYLHDVKVFECFLKGTSVTKQSALDWRAKFAETHAPATVNGALAALNGFFDFFELGIKVKPLKIQQRIYSAENKELTEKEYRKLLKTALEQGNVRLYYVLQTICATGIRVGELKFISVEGVRKGYVTVQNKGKIRTIFIPRDLQKVLLRYIKEQGVASGCVFVTRSGNPLNRSNIWSEMKKLCAAAGVNESKVFPHNLRKLFAKMFYAKDHDLSKLADSLGHSDVKTTRIYIMGTGNEHRQIINSLGLVVDPSGYVVDSVG